MPTCREFLVPVRVHIGTVAHGNVSDTFLIDVSDANAPYQPLISELASVTAGDLGLSQTHAHEISGQLEAEVEMFAPALRLQSELYAAMDAGTGVLPPNVHRFEVEGWLDGLHVSDTILWDTHVPNPASQAAMLARALVDDLGLGSTLESGLRWERAFAWSVLRRHYVTLLAQACGIPDSGLVTYRRALSAVLGGVAGGASDADHAVAAGLLEAAEGGGRRRRARDSEEIPAALQPALYNKEEVVLLFNNVEQDGRVSVAGKLIVRELGN